MGAHEKTPPAGSGGCPSGLVASVVLALLAFAANSVLCRFALQHTLIGPDWFTAIRLLSGTLVLWLIVRVRATSTSVQDSGSWWSACALFAYAAAFSFAYVALPAATGALLLFGAVQVTMIGHGLWTGQRLRALQAVGLMLAFAGLVVLLSPGLAAPPPLAAALMIVAGIAWGIYSLRGRRAGDPTRVTAGNFLRALPFALLLLLPWAVASGRAPDVAGVACAVASGALASGVGYALWYAALPSLASHTAAGVQLSVPVLAAIGGIVLLGEPFGPRLLVASVAVLGGIALVLLRPRLRD